MKFAVTSQDFLPIAPHAGRCTCFSLFEAGANQEPVETGRLDLTAT